MTQYIAKYTSYVAIQWTGSNLSDFTSAGVADYMLWTSSGTTDLTLTWRGGPYTIPVNSYGLFPVDPDTGAIVTYTGMYVADASTLASGWVTR